jgi:hypothetical protein
LKGLKEPRGKDFQSKNANPVYLARLLRRRRDGQEGGAQHKNGEKPQNAPPHEGLPLELRQLSLISSSFDFAPARRFIGGQVRGLLTS